MKFKLGDVVELPSGGPEMTVTYTPAGEKLECTWMLDGEVRTHMFHEDALISKAGADQASKL